MELTSLVPAASCWQCRTSGPNTAENAAMSRASSQTSSYSRSSRNMSSVRSGYSADWKVGMWLGSHAPCIKLTRVAMMWVKLTDCWLTGSGCCQVCDDHLAGKDRHNYGHKMTPGGLQALLPSRLTEITDWGEDKIWPGWTHTWNSSWVPLDESGVHLQSYIASTGTWLT